MMAWTASLNPLYRVLSLVRHSLIFGEVQWLVGSLMFVINVLGLFIALRWLNRERYNIPFLI